MEETSQFIYKENISRPATAASNNDSANGLEENKSSLSIETLSLFTAAVSKQVPPHHKTILSGKKITQHSPDLKYPAKAVKSVETLDNSIGPKENDIEFQTEAKDVVQKPRLIFDDCAKTAEESGSNIILSSDERVDAATVASDVTFQGAKSSSSASSTFELCVVREESMPDIDV